MMERRKAFSLVELMIVIAIIAIIAGVVSWQIYGVMNASNRATDKQNVSLWNTTYATVVAVDYVFPNEVSFSDLAWNEASNELEKGINIPEDSTFEVSIAKPSFHDSKIVDDYFEAGKGIVLPDDY